MTREHHKHHRPVATGTAHCTCRLVPAGVADKNPPRVPCQPPDTLFGALLGAGGTYGFSKTGSVGSLLTGVGAGAVRPPPASAAPARVLGVPPSTAPTAPPR